MNFPAITFEQILILYVINQVASALVQAAPIPVEGGNQFYAFIYKFLTLLVGDFKSFMTKLPALGTAQLTSSTGAITTVPTIPATSSHPAQGAVIESNPTLPVEPAKP